MAMKLHSLSVDLMGNTASVSLADSEGGSHRQVSIFVPLETPGNQNERHMEKTAKEVTKKALQDALNAL